MNPIRPSENHESLHQGEVRGCLVGDVEGKEEIVNVEPGDEEAVDIAKSGEVNGAKVGNEIDNGKSDGTVETSGETAVEDLCLPCNPVDGDDVEEEAEAQRVATDPGQPTKQQRDEHNVSHSPYRPWCKWCVMGRAQSSPSVRVRGKFAEHVLPRVRMDYCFLTEDIEKQEGEHGESETERAGGSMTVAVMQESLC